MTGGRGREGGRKEGGREGGRKEGEGGREGGRRERGGREGGRDGGMEGERYINSCSQAKSALSKYNYRRLSYTCITNRTVVLFCGVYKQAIHAATL